MSPIGKVNTGKPQLRIEEARRFTRAAGSYFEERQHPLAIGALLALTMGLRAGEVHQIQARLKQLDDNTLARLLELLESEKKGGASS